MGAQEKEGAEAKDEGSDGEEKKASGEGGGSRVLAMVRVFGPWRWFWIGTHLSAGRLARGGGGQTSNRRGVRSSGEGEAAMGTPHSALNIRHSSLMFDFSKIFG
jgi:hypothetical protein